MSKVASGSGDWPVNWYRCNSNALPIRNARSQLVQRNRVGSAVPGPPLLEAGERKWPSDGAAVFKATASNSNFGLAGDWLLPSAQAINARVRDRKTIFIG